MDVLEHDEQRAIPGERHQGRGDPLEHLQHVGAALQRVDDRGRSAERVDPGAERQDLLALVAPAHHHAGAARLGRADEVGHEPGLADAGLAEDGHHAALTGLRLLECVLERGDLGRPTDQRHLDGRRPRHPGGGRRGHHGLQPPRRGRLQDLLVQRLGLGLRLDAELAAEHGDALLVLPERRAPPPEVGVEAHQRAMHRFLQRVQREQSQRRLHARLGGAGPALLGEQPRQPLQRQLAQALALAQQPLLERRLVDHEAAEQIATIERAGLFQRPGRPLGHALLEQGSVHLDRAGHQ